MDKLDAQEIERRLADYPEWALVGGRLQRTLSFPDFAAAMDFVNRVADLAETLQHHPDIMIRYNKVTLTLETHDAGGLTESDFGFARDTDGMVQEEATKRPSD
jgi:4a-hydroxytetrahydrobiopterin dehydratase